MAQSAMRKFLATLTFLFYSTSAYWTQYPGQPRVAINADFLAQAQQQYNHLQNHPYCAAAFLRDHKALTAELVRIGAQAVTFKTSDGFVVNGWHINRGSQKLVIAAAGSGYSKERMINLVPIYEPYDVLLIDFRWQAASRCMPSTLLKSTLEIHAGLDWATKHNYGSIIGVGTCMSAALLLLAQQQAQQKQTRCFDVLVLDSCWPTLRSVASTFIQDPYLLRNPRGGAPQALKLLTGRLLYYPIYGAVCAYVPNIDLIKTIQAIHDTPILFVHGVDDRKVPVINFEQLLPYAKHLPAMALITPFHHSNSDKKGPVVYAYLVHQFIEQHLTDTKTNTAPTNNQTIQIS